MSFAALTILLALSVTTAAILSVNFHSDTKISGISSKIFSSVAYFDEPSRKYLENSFQFVAYVMNVNRWITFISNWRPTICSERNPLTADNFCISFNFASLYNSGEREWVSLLRLGSKRRGSFWWISARKCTSSTVDRSCIDWTM
jgi:hypothetical protein